MLTYTVIVVIAGNQSMPQDQRQLHVQLLMNPDYQRLRLRIRLYRRRMAMVIAGCYFLFLLTCVGAPELLFTPVSQSNPTPWLIPLSVFLILLQFLVTGIYVKQMNTVFDEEMKTLRREVGL